MMRLILLALMMSPAAAMADSMVATHTIHAQTVLTEDDFTMVAADIPGAVVDPQEAIGQEARVTLYAGRPILTSDLGTATLVDRNQTVSLIYQITGLSIATEGRALSRGSAGDVIKVMNLSSHTTVMGTIGSDGTVFVMTAEQG